MSIRLSAEDNERINKIVKNYNQRIKRANKINKVSKILLPEPASARIIKKSFDSRKDLERELMNMELFTSKAATTKIADWLTAYDYSMLKRNKQAATQYWEKRAESIRKNLKSPFPAENARLKTVEQNLEILKKPISEMSINELTSASRYVDKFRKSFERQATGYRGFLSEVEFVMKNVGISKSKRDVFFDKLTQLTPDEFYYMYDKYELIERIYDLADSPKYGDVKINTDEETARRFIDTMLEDIDVMIAETKYEYH